VLNFSGSFGASIGYKEYSFDNEDIMFSAFKSYLLLVLFQVDKDVEFFKFIDENKLLDELIKHPEMLQYLMPKLIASESGNHFREK